MSAWSARRRRWARAASRHRRGGFTPDAAWSSRSCSRPRPRSCHAHPAAQERAVHEVSRAWQGVGPVAAAQVLESLLVRRRRPVVRGARDVTPARASPRCGGLEPARARPRRRVRPAASAKNAEDHVQRARHPSPARARQGARQAAAARCGRRPAARRARRAAQRERRSAGNETCACASRRPSRSPFGDALRRAARFSRSSSPAIGEELWSLGGRWLRGQEGDARPRGGALPPARTGRCSAQRGARSTACGRPTFAGRGHQASRPRRARAAAPRR